MLTLVQVLLHSRKNRSVACRPPMFASTFFTATAIFLILHLHRHSSDGASCGRPGHVSQMWVGVPPCGGGGFAEEWPVLLVFWLLAVLSSVLRRYSKFDCPRKMLAVFGEIGKKGSAAHDPNQKRQPPRPTGQKSSNTSLHTRSKQILALSHPSSVFPLLFSSCLASSFSPSPFPPLCLPHPPAANC